MLAPTELQYPIQLRAMTYEETKEYHLKKFAQWGKKWEQEQEGEIVFGVDGNIYRNGKILAEEPNEEQKEWVLFRLSHPNTWPNVHENKIGDWKNWQ